MNIKGFGSHKAPHLRCVSGHLSSRRPALTGWEGLEAQRLIDLMRKEVRCESYVGKQLAVVSVPGKEVVLAVLAGVLAFVPPWLAPAFVAAASERA